MRRLLNRADICKMFKTGIIDIPYPDKDDDGTLCYSRDVAMSIAQHIKHVCEDDQNSRAMGLIINYAYYDEGPYDYDYLKGVGISVQSIDEGTDTIGSFIFVKFDYVNEFFDTSNAEIRTVSSIQLNLYYGINSGMSTTMPALIVAE